MLFVYKSFANPSLNSHELVNGTTLPPKAALQVCNEVVCFKVVDESVVYHAFEDFTEATGKRNRTIAIWVRGVLVQFWNCNKDRLLPISRKNTFMPSTIEQL